ncbi:MULTISPECIES: hypothetical protein [Phyllobacterium]|jgi:hypothetical protein|uniref:Uncharacterized protein n=1 Tax=Phyllobacterium sophorae TaxID=1520277 RepID=A0A2P7BLH3_9HYPH|nr:MULTISPECIES: hypothetical protein [Phyllobacterium]PSH67274.1 hypothetical protein CU103_02655 [Phyllobacterium sophorae]UXN65498.1 hypothetical protein N8E89_07700 [Phyllobacterium sp. A18/5-2]
MPQTYADLSISEVLSDPMINAVMRADHVTRRDLELLLKTAARENFETAPSRDWGQSLQALKHNGVLSLAGRARAACCEGAA